MSQTEFKAVIYSLRDSGMKIKDPSKDVRGRDVIGNDGNKLGMIDDLLMDSRHSRIRFIQIAHGGLITMGQDQFILPVNTITKIEDRKVYVDRSQADMERVSQYLPELEEGVDTGPAGWFEQGPGGLPGVAIQ